MVCDLCSPAPLAPLLASEHAGLLPTARPLPLLSPCLGQGHCAHSLSLGQLLVIPQSRLSCRGLSGACAGGSTRVTSTPSQGLDPSVALLSSERWSLSEIVSRTAVVPLHPPGQKQMKTGPGLFCLPAHPRAGRCTSFSAGAGGSVQGPPPLLGGLRWGLAAALHV